MPSCLPRREPLFELQGWTGEPAQLTTAAASGSYGSSLLSRKRGGGSTYNAESYVETGRISGAEATATKPPPACLRSEREDQAVRTDGNSE